MKIKKKFAALLLSVCMVLALLPAGALADSTVGTITVKDSTNTSAKASSTFNAYQIASFKASVDPSTNKTVYTDAQIMANFKPTVVAALSAAGLPTTGTDDVLLNELNDSKMSSNAMLTLASNLKSVVGTSTPIVSSNGQIKIPQFGYYLIVEMSKSSDDTTLYTDPILVGVPLKDASTITSTFDVKVKTSYATVQKKIVVPDPKDNTKNILVDSSTAKDQVGEPVNYQSISDIPFYSSLYSTPTYYVTDTFSAGLKFSGTVNASVVDKTGTVLNSSLVQGTDYTLDTNDHYFKLTLKPSVVMNYGSQGGKLKITYTATITDQAVVGSTGNPNTITLTYSNNPSNGTYTTPPDTVITYINLLTVNKLDNANTPVNGAGFTLYHKTGVDSSNQPIWSVDGDPTNEIVSTVGGAAQFKTLVPGNTYKLVETTVPAGLSKAADVVFTVKATNTNSGSVYDIPDQNIFVPTEGTDGASANTAIAKDFTATWTVPDNNNIKVATDGTMSTTIIDNRGFILPGTGGIGTTIFFASGIAILLLGGCMAFVYTRKKRTGSHFQH